MSYFYGLNPDAETGAAITGTLSVTAGAASISAAASVLVSGSLSLTGSSATLSGAGSVLVAGGLTKTLPSATLLASGNNGQSISIDVSFPSIGLSLEHFSMIGGVSIPNTGVNLTGAIN